MAADQKLAIVGGGPAGLMAAETACAAGIEVDLYEAMGSVGRKFLLAGKGGLNLTHSEPRDAFVRRYAGREAEVSSWLENFDSTSLRKWALELGVKTVIGTSGRVFPADFKAAPLLRAWVRRLRAMGVRFHVHHKCTGWDEHGQLRFATPQGERLVHADAVVLALGGGSWPQLGSDGAWAEWLSPIASIAPLQPANCGFDVEWSEHFIQRHAGHPIKPVVLSWNFDGVQGNTQGELTVTQYGIEGGLAYALAGVLRDGIASFGATTVYLDLAPGRDEMRLRAELSQPRGKRSLTEHLRRNTGIEGVKASLLYEVMQKKDMADPILLAAYIKALPIVIHRPRPLAEAISTAGGVRLEGLKENLMLRNMSGVFVAGEMLDWEAPTGGYLLTACFASGRLAGLGVTDWLNGNKTI